MVVVGRGCHSCAALQCLPAAVLRTSPLHQLLLPCSAAARWHGCAAHLCPRSLTVVVVCGADARLRPPAAVRLRRNRAVPVPPAGGRVRTWGGWVRWASCAAAWTGASEHGTGSAAVEGSSRHGSPAPPRRALACRWLCPPSPPTWAPPHPQRSSAPTRHTAAMGGGAGRGEASHAVSQQVALRSNRCRTHNGRERDRATQCVHPRRRPLPTAGQPLLVVRRHVAAAPGSRCVRCSALTNCVNCPSGIKMS